MLFFGEESRFPVYYCNYDLCCKVLVYVTSFTTIWDYCETKRNGDIVKKDKRIYMYIYFNEQCAVDDKITFNKYLDILEQELLLKENSPKHGKNYTKYFEIKETPK